MIGEPPSLPGAKRTRRPASSGSIEVIVGLAGTLAVLGVTETTAAGPLPDALLAYISQEYVVPFVSPLTSNGEPLPDTAEAADSLLQTLLMQCKLGAADRSQYYEPYCGRKPFPCVCDSHSETTGVVIDESARGRARNGGFQTVKRSCAAMEWLRHHRLGRCPPSAPEAGEEAYQESEYWWRDH